MQDLLVAFHYSKLAPPPLLNKGDRESRAIAIKLKNKSRRGVSANQAVNHRNKCYFWTVSQWLAYFLKHNITLREGDMFPDFE